ncbi:MAG: dihydroorotase [Treponema sp.]|jgi:dihydroorotase|nr:dihydroorotase [Treponema sp.]
MRTILKNFRLVDENTDTTGTLIIENGFISEVFPDEPNALRGTIYENESVRLPENDNAAIVIDGKALASSGELPLLMPAFVDLHAHFRDPGPHEKDAPFPAEVLESASLSAAAGGFGTVVCMANTNPPIDTIEKAAALKRRSDALSIIDLFPVLSLTKNMEGKELSEIKIIKGDSYIPLMLSEDGKDLADDDLFLAAMEEASRQDVPISCHCDLGGDEDSAVRRVIELGKKAGCHIHIAHVSTKEALETIHRVKQQILTSGADEPGFVLTCEATPHHLCLTEDNAKKLGEKTWGRVNPPLRSEEDRQALMHTLNYGVVDEKELGEKNLDRFVFPPSSSYSEEVRQALIHELNYGVVDAIATDHAPHTAAGKEAGAPGFSGFETAFAAVYTELVRGGAGIDLKRLSSLMSASPAWLLGRLDGGSRKRGHLHHGCWADLVIIDPAVEWTVDPDTFKSRGKNSPFKGRKLFGKILMTLHEGRVVYHCVE